MIEKRSPFTQGHHFSSWALPAGFLLFAWMCPMPAIAAAPASKASPTPLEREAMTLYRAAEYSRVIDLIQHPPTGQEPGADAIRYAILSYVKTGKPEEGWKLYPRITAGDRPDDRELLREVARGFIISRVRDSQEHIRIAAYTALAEMGEGDTLPLLEDGLLD